MWASLIKLKDSKNSNNQNNIWDLSVFHCAMLVGLISGRRKSINVQFVAQPADNKLIFHKREVDVWILDVNLTSTEGTMKSSSGCSVLCSLKFFGSIWPNDWTALRVRQNEWSNNVNYNRRWNILQIVSLKLQWPFPFMETM